MAEEQTKIKQAKSKLKALGCGTEHAGQAQAPWDNACQVFDHFEIREHESLSKHRYLLFITSTAVFDIKPVIVFNDERELQSKAKEA